MIFPNKNKSVSMNIHLYILRVLIIIWPYYLKTYKFKIEELIKVESNKDILYASKVPNISL